MEALNRLVTDSLVRHGFDRPIDPRRLQWSRWYPCNSPKSLLVVPSRPGIFAIAEEIVELGNNVATDAFVRPNVGTAALGCPTERSSVAAASAKSMPGGGMNWEGHDFSFDRALSDANNDAASAAEVGHMLAVLQFSEADDMAFTLDRMFTRPNPMRDRLTSGRCHLRFVTLGDDAQRRSICAALNQWMISSAQKAIGFEEAGFVGRTFLSATANAIKQPSQAPKPILINTPDSGSNKNIHCPQPLPSGF